MNGATTIATLQLAGAHGGDTFHVASDSAGGTNITVTTGPAHAVQFISGMADFGGGKHGPVSVHRKPLRPSEPLGSAVGGIAI